MIPLSKKLIISNVATIAVSLGALGGLSLWGLKTISTHLMALNERSSQTARQNLKELSDESTDNITRFFKDGMLEKGRAMIEKDSATILPMIEDNAFFQLRDFLKKNKIRDADLIEATFFVVEQGEVKAWQYVSSTYPDGLEMPILYNSGKQVWQARDVKGRRVEIPAPEVSALKGASGPSVQSREISLVDNKGGIQIHKVIECTIPIHKGGFGSKLDRARARGEPIGYLRYVLSLQKMEEVINAQTAVVNKNLEKLRVENDQSLEQARKVGADQLAYNIFILLIFGGALVLVAVAYSAVFSKKITGPIKRLKEYAEQMAEGHYRQEITVRTDDEIGVLANSFQEMSNAICKRDQDLAEINRNLEKLVDERTVQLKTELKKISDLLNNMQQSVFTVSSQLKVVPPVSKFSEDIFGEKIEGRSVWETLYAQIDSKSEEGAAISTVLSCVFGESDLQWDLVEQNLPRRIVRTDGKVLRVAYNPIWDANGNLENIMHVVQDVTALEELEKQVAAEREASGARIQMLQELGSNDPDALREYFDSAIRLLAGSLEQIKRITLDPAAQNLVLRNLHTLKGNSRLFNLSGVAAVTHSVENSLESLTDVIERNSSKDVIESATTQLLDGIGEIQRRIQDYAIFAQQVFRIENQFELSQIQNLHELMVAGESGFGAGALERLGEISRALSLRGVQTAIKACKLTHGTGSGALVLSRESARALLATGFFKPYPKTGSFWVPLFVNFLAYLDAGADQEKARRSLDHLHTISCDSHLGYLSPLINALFLERQDQSWDKTRVAELEAQVAAYLTLVLRINVLEMRRRYPQQEESWKKLAADLEVARSPEDSKVIAAQFVPETLFTSVLKGTARRGWSAKMVLGGLRLNASDLLSPKQGNRDDYLDALFRVESGEAPKPGVFSDWMGGSYLRMIDFAKILRGYVGTEELPGDATGAQMVFVLDSNLSKLKTLVDEQGSGDLKKAVLRLTEVPLRPVLKKYRNMVRELSARLGKKAQLKVTGDDVTLPKDILYGLEDALVHLLRNAVDHGIEAADVRSVLGKKSDGLITIEMSEREENVVLEVSDDGKGLDVAEILKKGIEKGIIEASGAERLTKEEIFTFIFMQNFSTKAEVSEISGRGVGMDIVKSSIERMGGKISLASEKGVGTKFTIEFKT